MDKKSAVVSFIEGERAKGLSETEIQHKLLDAGWQMDIIQWAMGTTVGDRAQPHVQEIKKRILLSSFLLVIAMGAKKIRRQSKRSAK